MSQKRSERSRWTTVFTLSQPWPNDEGGPKARTEHDQLRAVVKAFDAVGRVVRVETTQYGEGLVFKARRA